MKYSPLPFRPIGSLFLRWSPQADISHLKKITAKTVLSPRPLAVKAPPPHPVEVEVICSLNFLIILMNGSWVRFSIRKDKEIFLISPDIMRFCFDGEAIVTDAVSLFAEAASLR